MQRRATHPIPWNLLPLVLALAVFAGCPAGCHEIDPEGPEALPPPAYERPTARSTLYVPIEIPVEEISALVNRVVKRDLYSVRNKRVKRGLLRARLDLNIRRNGAIYTRTRNGKIINHLPLVAEGRVKVPPGIWRPFSTTFTVHATSDLSLDEDWATVSRTHGLFTWEEAPFIKVLKFKLSLKKTAERALTKELAKLAPKIDDVIEDRINLRRRVDRIWESLHEPIAIQQNPPVWLTIRPVETHFAPAVSRNDTFVVGLQIHAFLETTVGSKPDAAPLGDLPLLQRLPDATAPDTAATFEAHLPVSITYEDARKLLAETVARQDFEVKDGVAVSVKGIDLYGHGAAVVARVDFEADVTDTIWGTQGRVFLVGTPVYDAATQTVRVDSFAYDVHSQNALAEAADWFYREEFLAQTQALLVFPLAENIAAAREQLQEALHDRPLGKHIILHGTVDDFVPGAIYLVEEGISVDLSARGRLSARVHSLEDIPRRRKR